APCARRGPPARPLGGRRRRRGAWAPPPGRVGGSGAHEPVRCCAAALAPGCALRSPGPSGTPGYPYALGVAELSVVVVAHNMGRELPRTARSLGHRHQRGTTPGDVELVVVDNGSAAPVDADALAAELGSPVRLERIDPAPPSPAHA